MPNFSPAFVRCFPHAVHGYVLTALLALSQPRSAKAEDSLTYRFQSWQEENQRIRVDSHYALAEGEIGTDTRIKVMGLIDSIAGATPTGELTRTAGGTVPLSHMDDVRHAWSADLSHQFKRVNFAAGYAASRESDYVSKGWSLNTVTDFNQKNTNLLLGFGRTDDTIMERQLGWTTDRDKTGNDYIVGLTQVFDANTTGSCNVSYGQSKGFLSDPYKIVSTTMLDADPGFYYTPPENRPREKNKLSVMVAGNRNYEKVHGALEASYRFYHDTFGIKSHTITLLWVQDIGSHFMLQPSARLYRQSAGDFYYYDLDHAGIVTAFDPVAFETGTGKAPFYSSDYRLSKMQTMDLGLKLTWKVKSWLWIDAAYNRYLARGLDHVTPQDVYSQANVFTVGARLFR